MNSDSEREVAVFTEALKVPIQERNAFLQRMCGADEELRHKIHALLRSHDRLGDFLEEPPTGSASIDTN